MNARLTTFCIALAAMLGVEATGGPRVPSHLEFAGMKLNIDHRARKQIQQNVDALTKNAGYLERRIQRVDMYFPIIERIFRSAGLPEDFKYLVIQESALVGDAVSRSNAVGYWQFKEATALEMGLRVDRRIDERKNIHASTRAAASYLKKNYIYLENWVYALLAYNTGLGGVEKFLKGRYRGAGSMDINSDTHWYIKKFLAHVIAFRHEIGKQELLPMVFYEFNDGVGMSLEEIAEEYSVDPKLVVEHNHWLHRGTIPDDRQYTVLIPLPPDQVPIDMIAVNKRTDYREKQSTTAIVPTRHTISTDKINYAVNAAFPIIEKEDDGRICRINGMPGTVARRGDTPSRLASLAGLSFTKFLRFNDMVHGEAIETGQVYYFRRKRNKAKVHFHVVEAGETLWDVSQKYGIKLKKLLRKNRMRAERHSEPGRVLWMRFIRPSETPVEYKKVKPVEEKAGYIADAGHINPTISHIKADPPAVDERAAVDGQGAHRQEASESGYIHKGTYIRLDEDEAHSNTPEPGPGDVLHEVRPGETLFSITQMYDVPLGQVRDWNNLDVTAPIHPGQKILIRNATGVKTKTIPPAQSAKEQSIIIHKVKSDETLYGIARKYGVEIGQIMQWNNKEDFQVSVDEELTIHQQ